MKAKKISEELEKIKQKKWQKRVEKFTKDYIKLCREHKVAYTAVLSVSERGVVPVIKPIDVTDELKEEEKMKDKKK